MSDNNTSAINVANYMLESILKDLNFLKENNFLSSQVYQDVTNILPTQITSTIQNNPPLLPTRKSNHSINNPPIPQPRDINNSLPKLPTRRTPDWQQPQVNQIIENEKSTHSTPPPAYSQNPNINEKPSSLATAEALYDYEGEDPTTDLSFKQGEIIEVTEYVNDDWWKGTVNGRAGIFPQNHVKKIPPPIKAKRPWAPPTSSKPSSFNNNNQNNINNNNLQPITNSTMPYSYPPPPNTLYSPPPQQQPSVIIVNNTAHENNEHGGENKVQNMAKKFGGHVATAATWGFGATLGSQAANAIF